MLGPASAFAPAERDSLAAALALPVASELVGARDAPRFAWVEKAAGVRNIWIADRGRPARKITDYRGDDGLELSDLELSRDGSALAFVRGGDPEFPDDPLPNAAAETSVHPQQVFVVAPGSGTPEPIGAGHSPVFSADGRRLAFTRHGEIWLWERGREARKLATVPGEARRLAWSPDGARLLFVDHRDDHSFVALLDVAGPSLRYLDPGLGFAVEPDFSPDGRQVAFVHYVEPPAGAAEESGPYWAIRVADVATGRTRTLWTAPPGSGGRFEGTRGKDLYWSSDGKLVLPWERSGWLHPYAIDSAHGGTPADLTPGDFEVESYFLDSGGRSLVYAGNSGDLDRRHVWRRPLTGGAPVAVTAGRGIESSPTLAGDALAVIATDVTHPAYPALVDRGLKPLKPAAAASNFVAPKPVTFKAADGVEIHAMLFEARGPGRHPALVFVHGGPRRQMLPGFHPSGYYSNAYIFNQHLAERGYAVLAVNYRSGTGFGARFRDDPEQARAGASEYRDVLAAGRWLAARPDVDPARIGIWG
ncbi:MAG: prolyl oligopeptidase family serine peptidase, partial [Allosphingosinicella sp.]